jgi:hypothetical protein
MSEDEIFSEILEMAVCPERKKQISPPLWDIENKKIQPALQRRCQKRMGKAKNNHGQA